MRRGVRLVSSASDLKAHDEQFLESGAGDMPTIRTIRPTDLVPLISFLRNGPHREVTASLWPEVGRESDTRLIRGLLPHLIMQPGRSHAWLCLNSGAVHGFAIAHPRAGRLVWDVKHLYVTSSSRQAGAELLDHIASEAAKRGCRRVFLSTPVDGELSRIAGQGGFVNYTSESLYWCRLPEAVSADGLASARPRLRQDGQALFHLYNATVPCRVRSAEALTMEEWSSLEKGDRPWAPSLGGNRQHLVWESREGLTGWLRITFAAKSQHLELLVHPSHHKMAEEMVQYALSQVSPRAPVYFSVRDYQPEIAAVLHHRGFTLAAEYLLFARELAVRVPNRGLVPARA